MNVGLDIRLHIALDKGFDGGLCIECDTELFLARIGLDTGLHAGLNAGLNTGLDSGLDTVILDWIYNWILDTELVTGLDSMDCMLDKIENVTLNCSWIIYWFWYWKCLTLRNIQTL